MTYGNKDRLDSDYTFANPPKFLQQDSAASGHAADVRRAVELTAGIGAGYPANNPKDSIGRSKLPLSLWPASATAVGCLGLLEGKIKYGRSNWRASPVSASVYIDALLRHVSLYSEGENLSSDVGNLHLGNALACLAILVDSAAHGTLVDDRQYTPSSTGRETRDLFARLTPMVQQLQDTLAGHIRNASDKDWDRRSNAAGQRDHVSGEGFIKPPPPEAVCAPAPQAAAQPPYGVDQKNSMIRSDPYHKN